LPLREISITVVTTAGSKLRAGAMSTVASCESHVLRGREFPPLGGC
jgi:hypothetical protein